MQLPQRPSTFVVVVEVVGLCCCVCVQCAAQASASVAFRLCAGINRAEFACARQSCKQLYPHRLQLFPPSKSDSSTGRLADNRSAQQRGLRPLFCAAAAAAAAAASGSFGCLLGCLFTEAKGERMRARAAANCLADMQTDGHTHARGMKRINVVELCDKHARTHRQTHTRTRRSRM